MMASVQRVAHAYIRSLLLKVTAFEFGHARAVGQEHRTSINSAQRVGRILICALHSRKCENSPLGFQSSYFSELDTRQPFTFIFPGNPHT
jgi:hypothetical protein